MMSAAICVPVRDEAESLPFLLRALAEQASDDVALVACFLLDSCTDRSEVILREAAATFPFPIRIGRNDCPAEPNAGIARRAAMQLGLDALEAPGGMLLTTDADSRPRPSWIMAACHALSLADIAAGRIVRLEETRDPIQTRIERYYDRLHGSRRVCDPVPWDVATGHHFSGGANLAFRAGAYRELGGFAPLACGEDAALLDSASRAGFHVRRDPAMIVETSSRRDGRAVGGLAAALREIDAAGLPRVAHPAGAVWQYRAHADARAAFAQIDSARVRAGFGRAIGLDGDHVLGVARDCPNAEAFAMRIVPAAPGGERFVSLPEAEDALAALEQGPRERAA